jgi:hypothetical protein
VVIDLATGPLLATEDIGPMPASAHCMTFQYTHGQQGCIGPSYLGRTYQGQADESVALVSAGWTNASPSLPRSIHEDPTASLGLPPAGP